MLRYIMLGLDVSFLQPLINALNVILIPVVALLASAGTIYSIILAVNMAKADSADKRQIAKKRIIGVLITVACIILLLFGLQFILQNLQSWVGDTTSFIGLI